MPQTTTARTISVLRLLFSGHGLPEEIVWDNGSQFTSAEFAEFTKKNGIKRTNSSPYHPASNGEAGWLVHKSIKVRKNNVLTLSHRSLLTYRTTPHSTTGTPPCELLMGRSLHTCWDLLKSDKQKCRRRAKQERHARPRPFYIGHSVMAQILVLEETGFQEWLSGNWDLWLTWSMSPRAECGNVLLTTWKSWCMTVTYLLQNPTLTCIVPQPLLWTTLYQNIREAS